MRQLKKISSDLNPLLLCQAKYNLPHNLSWNRYRSHFNNYDLPHKCLMYVRCMVVALKGKFCMPEWGLYNDGALLGTVVEIKFAQGETPAIDCLPLYIVVNFPHYKGLPHHHGYKIT